MKYIIEIGGENPGEQLWEGTVTLEAMDATAAIEAIRPDLESTCMVVRSVNPWEPDEEPEPQEDLV